MPGERLASVHLTTMHPANPSWRDDELEARWERLLKVRDEALKLLEAMRKSGTIGAPLDAAISLGADGGSEGGLAETLTRYREELKDLFIVSDVAIARRVEAADVRRQANGREDFALDGTVASPAPRRIPQSRWSGVTRRARNARDAGSTSTTAAAKRSMRDAVR